MKRYSNTSVLLKVIRGERTQVEMSKKLRCHVQFVSNWERGVCLPPVPAMKRLYKDMTVKQRKYFEKCVGADLTGAFMSKIKG